MLKLVSDIKSWVAAHNTKGGDSIGVFKGFAAIEQEVFSYCLFVFAVIFYYCFLMASPSL